MKDDQRPSPAWRGALMAEAHALALTVATIRRARGKPNPEDYAVDSPEWHEIAADFARDVLRMLECDSVGLSDEFDVIHRDVDDDYLGIGAAG
ncbi:hypothetical protein [Caballeronia arvi]|nr:hypothetical protein [Caballeronia arvi]